LENPAKILIVDDEAYIRRVIELKLKNKGYEIITASNGKDGLEKFDLYHPEIVITDIKMPGMDGRSLCEQIEKRKNEKSLLLVIITCSVSDDKFEWLEKMNNTLLIEKPFSPSQLLDSLDDYLNNRKNKINSNDSNE
jgi:DNA-binding response OmpR family regulator